MNRRDSVFGRRDFLLASGALAMIGTLSNTCAHGKALSEGNESVMSFEFANDESVTYVAAAARRCVMTAEACIDHLTNDPGLSAQDSHRCVGLDEAVIAVCGAVVSLASAKSSYLASITVIAIEICNAYEKECDVRKDHQSCVDCAKACRSFIDECRRATLIVEYNL